MMETMNLLPMQMKMLPDLKVYWVQRKIQKGIRQNSPNESTTNISPDLTANNSFRNSHVSSIASPKGAAAVISSPIQLWDQIPLLLQILAKKRKEYLKSFVKGYCIEIASV